MNSPLPRNHFRVEWGGTRIGFTEISGLSIELEAPAFRDGASSTNSNVAMPGMLRYPHLVLKRPVMKGDNECFDWLNTVRLNSIERRDVSVLLLDERHQPVVAWRIRNAFPVKLDYTPLNAHESGPMMEILELIHEGMTIEHL